MGQEFESGSSIGIFLTKDDLKEAGIIIEVSETTKKVKKYNVNTGEPEIVEVQDQPYHWKIEFNGRRYSDTYGDGKDDDQLLDGVRALAKSIGLDICYTDDSYGEFHGYVIGFALDDNPKKTISLINKVVKKEKAIQKLFKTKEKVKINNLLFYCG